MKHPEENLEENVLQRWSRRKHEAEAEIDSEELDNKQMLESESEPEKPALTDADMPPIESLDEDSDYSGFLSPEVSEGLRKLALKKLFHMPTFNVRDGLDDYDGDYTEFAKLGSLITADMKHMLEIEAKRKLEQLAEEDADAGIEHIAEDEVDEGDDALMLADSEDVLEDISDDVKVDELELNKS
ncbi:MAG TPA: DUF3306 domain-containing protein [Chromatiales bacterium]|nr:DUF3306 domain-containing protein [Thiotrichales bacterium]HIP69058.1 DUF3306 domain-containing protein [Chromatiales bacterium]